MGFLTVENLSFARGQWNLEDLSFTLERGEVLSVVGPSGCGKSTLLFLLLGLLRPTRGRITLEGIDVTGPGRERMIVFQDHALLPWLTCLANVRFSLETARAPVPDLNRRALEYLKKVGLENHAAKYPAALSGGMRQRLGLARALAADPKLLLLDEPFSSLDAIRRQLLVKEMTALVRRETKTVVFVTHDIGEALRIGDRVLILGGSKAILTEPEQTSEREIYAHLRI